MQSSNHVSRVLLVLVFGQSLLGSPGSVFQADAQIDGSFWWKNENLVKKAEEYREEKDVKAIVVNNETEFDSIRLQDNAFTETSDDSPDCICVPSERCRSATDGKQGRDALCGPGNTCCRHKDIIPLVNIHAPHLPPPPTQPTPRPTLAALGGLPLRPPADLQSASMPPPTNSKPDILLEISSLLQEFNNDDFEPEAEFIFEMIPSQTTVTTSTTTTTRPSTTAKTSRPTPGKREKKCGQRRAPLTSRVHFMDDDERVEVHHSGTVSFGEFPWTIYVEERIGNGSFLYKCGGALITSGAVVTAGHCVANSRNDPSNFRIIAGDWDRRHTLEKLPRQLRTVDRIILHPNYYSGSLYNDVAVLIFNIPLNDSLTNVANVCLPSSKEDNFYGSHCILTGWGATPGTPEQEESIQRFVSMPLLPEAHCEPRLQSDTSLGRRFKMHKSFLCAGGTTAEDSCKGSGGSPLVCEHDGAFVLVGLMSWGVSCGRGLPVVLASVPAQVEWIRRQIDGLDDNVVYFEIKF
ncbi:phenoloxidase-activating factor 2-like [Malaya genurostris]|uniref:phenoloxidase-activating factor 2-like n=1 Tax=Malaya genurostris TaxID=325434 RepID=UPI0026F3C92C|nr:phenoloxidase-activating factor 2-like [Malaya genurostris]